MLSRRKQEHYVVVSMYYFPTFNSILLRENRFSLEKATNVCNAFQLFLNHNDMCVDILTKDSRETSFDYSLLDWELVCDWKNLRGGSKLLLAIAFHI